MKPRTIIAGVLILSSVLKSPNQTNQTPAIAAQDGGAAVKPATKETAFEFLNPRTVHIMVGNSVGSGSILPGNRILTCNHVVRGSETAQVRLGDKKTVLPAKVIKRNEGRDLALLKMESPNELPSIQLAPRAALPGEKIFVLGSPKGEQGKLVEGAVKGNLSQGDAEIAAPIRKGNSGGALALPLGNTFVHAGVVCGVPKESPDPSVIAFSVSLDAVKELVGGVQ